MAGILPQCRSGRASVYRPTELLNPCKGKHLLQRAPLKLGRLNERHMRIEDQYGRLKRKTV